MSKEIVQKFLDMVIELVHSNPSLHITDRFIYAQLVSFRLGNNVIPFQNVEKYFRNWISNFQGHPVIEVYRDKKNPYICHFSSKREADSNIKLYIPFKENYIKDAVIELFSFLTKENIVHDSKVLSSVRNDNVVVKVSTIEDANRIVKFIKGNSYLSEGLLNANPFLIPCYKIGVIMDDHYTYNIEVCKVIATILEELRNRGELNHLDISFLRNTFAKLSIKCSDDELSDLYRLTSIALDENATLQDFANYVLEHQQISYINKHGNIDTKNSVEYLNQAIIETFHRYNNLSYVINAVKLYLTNGETRGFTRINRARQNLKLYADKEQLKKMFEEDNLDFSIKYYLLKVITNED